MRSQLKDRYERDIVVHGSPQLAQAARHDLVDELRLMAPLSAPARLAGTTREELRLVETKTFDDGIHVSSIGRRRSGGCSPVRVERAATRSAVCPEDDPPPSPRRRGPRSTIQSARHDRLVC
jgi:hypothetical protein